MIKSGIDTHRHTDSIWRQGWRAQNRQKLKGSLPLSGKLRWVGFEGLKPFASGSAHSPHSWWSDREARKLGCWGRSCRGRKPQHPCIKFTQILDHQATHAVTSHAEYVVWRAMQTSVTFNESFSFYSSSTHYHLKWLFSLNAASSKLTKAWFLKNSVILCQNKDNERC